MNEEHNSEPSSSEKLAGPFVCVCVCVCSLARGFLSFLTVECFHFFGFIFLSCGGSKSIPKDLGSDVVLS